MTHIATPLMSGQKWALVGHGEVASAVAAAWQGPHTLVQWGQFDHSAPWVDGVILAESRLKMAYDAALSVLARGVVLAVTDPQLLAVHGRILDAAARSSGGKVCPIYHGGAYGDGYGNGVAMGAEMLVICGGGAADHYTNRLLDHGDAPERAEKLVRWQGELADWDGKVTHAHALALHGQWCGWSRTPTVTRVAASTLTEAAVRAVAGASLRLRYGATLTASEVVVGPLVLAGNAALGSHDTTGLMVRLPHGWQTTTTAATVRPLQQLVANLSRVLAQPRLPRVVAPAPLPATLAWQDFGGVMLPCVGMEALRRRA